eukprot:TRINITY_DN6067_c0_g2_i5.p1 TRINITY_DN6067_c0_g2~~TRINITY_DN6067_c0_g2_i5.p1  ORF type:complete len:528 (+),score=127.18 TRINITY_DN6067_c0_g2_i5:168-1751(+)
MSRLVFFLAVLLGVVTCQQCPGPSSYSFTFSARSGFPNPIKGLYSWQNVMDSPWPPASSMPTTLEYVRVLFKNLYISQNQYNWTHLDTFLDSAKSRGRQAVVRFVLDLPAEALQPNYALPQFIIVGCEMVNYTDYGSGVSPRWTCPLLQATILRFIRDMAARYDGDARIGSLQSGLLGFWGEQHSTETNPIPPEFCQQFVLTFTQSFHITLVSVSMDMVRLLTAASQTNTTIRLMSQLAPNIGYYDDCFGQCTAAVNVLGAPADSYSTYASLIQGQATSVWKTAMMGGEIKPENQAFYFSRDIIAAAQNASLKGSWADPAVVAATPGATFGLHTWQAGQDVLRASTMNYNYPWSIGFADRSDEERALNASAYMGYSLHVSQATALLKSVSVSTYSLDLSVRIVNMGNAPFYLPLTLTASVAGCDAGLALSGPVFQSLMPASDGLYTVSGSVHCPNQLSTVADVTLALQSKYVVAPFVRFADQEIDAQGRLVLRAVSVCSAQVPLATSSSHHPFDLAWTILILCIIFI